jgi:hypothetical protein
MRYIFVFWAPTATGAARRVTIEPEERFATPAQAHARARRLACAAGWRLVGVRLTSIESP